jgi:hypothetical protein
MGYSQKEFSLYFVKYSPYRKKKMCEIEFADLDENYIP